MLREKWKIDRTSWGSWEIRPPGDLIRYKIYRNTNEQLVVARWFKTYWLPIATIPTWNDGLKVITYREEQKNLHREPIHHLEPCS